MDFKLSDKRVLVTGSSSGIGVAIAKMLAREGAQIFVTGRNEERTKNVADDLSKMGGKVAYACADLQSADAISALSDSVIEAFGGLDILVNNAGGSSDKGRQSWLEMDPSEWAETYETNVLAAVRLIRKFVPEMKERGWGRIINISTAAAITPTSGQPDYGPAKAAMLNMSLGLSKALSRSGVTSNCVSPGLIRTEGLMDFLSDFAKKRGWGDDVGKAEEYIIKAGGQTAKRVGEVDDIAYAVAFLASPNADFINGTNLHIDGGISPSLL